ALGQTFLQAVAQGAVLRAVRPDRREPMIPRAVGALRQPYPAGSLAEVGLVREHGQAQLPLDALVATQQRPGAVRRRTGDEFNLPLLHEVAESAEHVAPQGVEEITGLTVESDPVLGQCRQVILVRVKKMRIVLGTGVRAGVEKNSQFLLQQRTG